MIGVNLMPRHIIAIRAGRRRARKWGVAIAVWITALVGTTIALGSLRSAASESPLAIEVDELSASTSRRKDEIAEIDRRLVAQGRSIAAARATFDHPDWSILLARLSAERDPETSFTRWRLSNDAAGLVLRLEGEGGGVAGLTDYVMRLEATGAFRRVTLVSAKAKGTGAKVDFVIEGLLAEAEKKP